MKIIRRSNERGVGDHGWLKSFHTFSFADYYDQNHMGFGHLRVINEDRVAAGKGFDLHPHKNMEIFSYVISGELAHKDSLGNEKIVKAGEVQVMSAGSGVLHSEYNPSSENPVHFMQIWIKPNKLDQVPAYTEWKAKPQDNNITLLLSADGRGTSVKINQFADVYIGKLEKLQTISFSPDANNKIWLQVISGNLNIDSELLTGGDGIAITNESNLDIRSNADSLFLLFNMY